MTWIDALRNVKKWQKGRVYGNFCENVTLRIGRNPAKNLWNLKGSGWVRDLVRAGLLMIENSQTRQNAAHNP